MIELTPAQRRELRSRAHHLNPVVTIAGNGLAPAVVAEIERSLQAHELIKVRVQGAERDQRENLMAELCATLGAAAVQHIGNILVVWREKKEDPKGKAAAEAEGGKRGPRPSTAKSAASFAAAARRAALAKAAAEKRRSPARAPAARIRTPGSTGRSR